ncbi:hypothetical protein Dip510_001752 [Elusimicrobium posterum]|uniref:hypothetical protein n=1 Tax=Elusimicrobium posterum TaxID=3116653 RepID=UPI003C758D8D
MKKIVFAVAALSLTAQSFAFTDGFAKKLEQGKAQAAVFVSVNSKQQKKDQNLKTMQRQAELYNNLSNEVEVAKEEIKKIYVKITTEFQDNEEILNGMKNFLDIMGESLKSIQEPDSVSALQENIGVFYRQVMFMQKGLPGELFTQELLDSAVKMDFLISREYDHIYTDFKISLSSSLKAYAQKAKNAELKKFLNTQAAILAVSETDGYELDDLTEGLIKYRTLEKDICDAVDDVIIAAYEKRVADYMGKDYLKEFQKNAPDSNKKTI